MNKCSVHKPIGLMMGIKWYIKKKLNTNFYGESMNNKNRYIKN